VHITSLKIFYNFLISLFLSSNEMYLLCTVNFNICQKIQPLFLALGGWLKEKNRPLNGLNKIISEELFITSYISF